MRAKLCLILTLCCLTAASWAETPSPQQFVEQTADDAIARLKAEREQLEKNPERLYDVIQDLLLPHFDFDRMAKWVLARHWRDATPEQRERFIEEFRTLLVRTYASSLLKYIDNPITYARAQWSPGETEAVVQSEVERSGAKPVEVNYRMHLADGQWKIYDVTVDNISLVINYRSSFASEINRKGMDGLIEALAAKNREAAASG